MSGTVLRDTLWTHPLPEPFTHLCEIITIISNVATKAQRGSMTYPESNSQLGQDYSHSQGKELLTS